MAEYSFRKAEVVGPTPTIGFVRYESRLLKMLIPTRGNAVTYCKFYRRRKNNENVYMLCAICAVDGSGSRQGAGGVDGLDASADPACAPRRAGRRCYFRENGGSSTTDEQPCRVKNFTPVFPCGSIVLTKRNFPFLRGQVTLKQ